VRTENPGIFADLKVLELGAGAAGPIATRYFADHGATVIRIESSARPDFLRTIALTPDNPFGLDGSPMFVLMNANKLSVSINMTRPEGVELVKRLVRWADVVSENFSPKAMTRWGLDYERLREENPEVVMVSGCLFGQTGPQRMYPGFGGQGAALSGFNHLTGWPDREAVGPYGTITDSLAPRYVALGIVTALLQKLRTGKGRYLDVSQIETAVYSLSELIVRYSERGEVITRDGNRCEYAAPHGVYPCAGDERWIAIAVFSDDAWNALVGAMGSPSWADGARYARVEGRLAHRDELDERLAAWTRGFEPYDLMERLQAAGVEAGVAQNFADLRRDPQLAHRGHFQQLEHVHLGALAFENYALRFSESDPTLREPGPNLGEHNQLILGGFLGMSRAEIDSLVEQGVIA
jgi:benzylsuccinate CoA-transferase BbsF subunit